MDNKNSDYHFCILKQMSVSVCCDSFTQDGEVFHTAEATSVHPLVRPVTQQVAFPLHSGVTNKQTTGRNTTSHNDTKVPFIISPFCETKTGCKDHVLHFSKSEEELALASFTDPSRRRKTVVLLFLHPLFAQNRQRSSLRNQDL